MKKSISVMILSILLTCISLAIVDLPWLVGDEGFLLKKMVVTKKFLNQKVIKNKFYDNNFVRDNFLIINTTQDQELPIIKSGIDSGLTKNPITSREKLWKLLKLLNDDTSAFNVIICDVMFNEGALKPEDDDSLKSYITKLEIQKKIIFGVPHDVRTDMYEKGVITLEDSFIGSTTKQTASDLYIKHKLFITSKIKSLPLLMYERINNKYAEKSSLPGIVKISNKYYYNSYLPELLFTREDFNKYYFDKENGNQRNYDSSIAICNLSKITSDTNGIFLKSLLYKESSKKSIFIGAISGEHIDKHATLFGDLDGSIILLNTYYNLILGYNKLSKGYLIISLLFFAYISYRLLTKEKQIEKKSDQSLKSYFWGLVKDRFFYLVLALLTIVGYFGFNHSTNLLGMIILLEILNFIISHARNYRIVKREISN